MYDKFLSCRSKKGFTLMEMLIVVAIIAILVAIAIPVFNAQLQKARIAVDQANMRSAASAATTLAMTTDLNGADADNPYKGNYTAGTGTAGGTWTFNFDKEENNLVAEEGTTVPAAKYNESAKNDTVGANVAAKSAYITVVLDEDFKTTSVAWTVPAATNP